MRKEEWKEIEYKEIVIDAENKSFLLKGYECFGWEEDDSIYQYNDLQQYSGKMILRLKRNCKLINRVELTRLQRKYESYIKDVDKLEKSKTLMANVYSLGLGIMGTGILGCALWLLNQQPEKMELGMLLLLIAILEWIFPVYIYKKTYAKESKKINPYIEEKYEEIRKTCTKGQRLLYKDSTDRFNNSETNMKQYTKNKML